MMNKILSEMIAQNCKILSVLKVVKYKSYCHILIPTELIEKLNEKQLHVLEKDGQIYLISGD